MSMFVVLSSFSLLLSPLSFGILCLSSLVCVLRNYTLGAVFVAIIVFQSGFFSIPHHLSSSLSRKSSSSSKKPAFLESQLEMLFHHFPYCPCFTRHHRTPYIAFYKSKFSLMVNTSGIEYIGHILKYCFCNPDYSFLT